MSDISPVSGTKKIKEVTLDFHGAIDALLDNKRVSRKGWNDKRWYCLLRDDILQIHKPGESEKNTHPWVINNGDLGGLDWYVL